MVDPDTSQLNRYFKNCKWTHSNGKFELLGPGLSYLGLDTNLVANLTAFTKGKVAITDIQSYHEVKNGYNLCFEDTWSLLFWVEYLNANPGVRNINIIHLDDHLDLMSPLLYKKQNKYFHVTEDKQIQFNDASDIASLIEDGSINLGSFIVPLIFFLDRVNIYHLKRDPSLIEPIKWNLIKSSINEYPYPDKDRIAISFTDIDHEISDGYYYQGCDLKSLLSDLNSDHTFLHIDLDYFLNQFNGNFGNDASVILTHAELEVQIQAICSELIKIRSQIVDLTIATSPGFCPSSHWAFLINCFMKHYRRA